MARDVKISTATVNRRASEHKAAWDGFFLECHDNSAGIPANAEDAALGNKLIVYSLDGLGVTGITYEATSTDGLIKLDSAKVFAGVGLIVGDLAYARMVLAGDDGTLSTTQERIQLTIGAGEDFDINITDLSVAVGVTKNLGALSYTASKTGG